MPLTIMAGERTFVDDARLDPREMLDYLAIYKGRSTTACPNPDDWRAAFGEVDEVLDSLSTGPEMVLLIEKVVE